MDIRQSATRKSIMGMRCKDFFLVKKYGYDDIMIDK